MRLYNVHRKLIFKNLKKYKINWSKPSRSKIQFEVKQFLKPYWSNNLVYEEMPVYGTRLSCDIVNLTLKIAIEVDGEQHEKLHFFHSNSRNKFRQSLRRDVQKEEWLEINNIKLCRIYEKEVKHLSKAFFEKKFGVIL